MKPAKRKSLKRRLTIQLLLFQIGSLFIVSAGFVAYLSTGGGGSALLSPQAAQITANALVRDKDGRLVLKETSEFVQLRSNTPDFWFVAVSETGEIVQGGQVPEAFSNMDQQLSDVKLSDIRDAALSYSYLAVVRIAVVRRVSGPVGEFAMIGKGGPFSMTFPVLLFSNILIMPILILMSIVTIVTIPWIIRREFLALSAIARTAETIDIDKRGYRLPDGDIPREVQPLVHAVNGALKRLDDGYERHKRFILDAAHELRTPVAILQTRVETLLDGPSRSRILADASRIAVLAEQLLDLQRLGGQKAPLIPLDLVSLCRSVVADMAPLAISQGYELSFEPEEEPILALADDASLQRALMNIVQNAIEHGGNRGTITIKVAANRVIDICDEGSGIPEEDRELVFDAFHRLRPKDRGTGLGLNLVQEIIRYHGGEITISDSSTGGACFRISLPYC
ncbi:MULTISPECIES: sensor histidine kinase [Rhizobium/Agrobacterium group]|uniref:histidine kinase n=1 Tax=Agrobacterium tumefaciens TaxID=358 RepID=A0AAE6ELY4_AGRTU|nr:MULTISPECIES: HAMP domain-containing sensor histidine kinase [Rhizobium/Agrobacterium group]KNY33096.1 histidine kinase [Agrobacterium sp. SUL3]MCA2371950.1 HAMP domain-containing histidine kinase [Agrobacterium tomkonis CIP 111-78]MCD4660290.1 HAMP domain-containing histidine kinase [Agrobacterium sp.]MCZ7452261.1 HAMP domain-containing sensor histidine kinase [Rhizobium rhizogenes]QCM02282.1 HAMP domain-containing histidine kinase [Agrobacterium tumefaciens]